MDNKLTKIRLTCFAGFAVTAATVVSLPAVLIPAASRSDGFWLRILWAEFLVLVVWSSLYSYFAPPLHPNEPRTGVGRVSPLLGIGGFWYAMLSLALLIGRSWLPSGDWLDRFHLAAQIVLAAMAVLLGVLLRINLIFGKPKPRANSSQNPTQSNR